MSSIKKVSDYLNAISVPFNGIKMISDKEAYCDLAFIGDDFEKAILEQGFVKESEQKEENQTIVKYFTHPNNSEAHIQFVTSATNKALNSATLSTMSMKNTNKEGWLINKAKTLGLDSNSIVYPYVKELQNFVDEIKNGKFFK